VVTSRAATGAGALRVVLIGPTWPFRGGIAQYTSELARQLGQRHEVTLLSFVRQYPRWLFPGRTDRDPSAWVSPNAAEYILDPLALWTWWRTARRVTALCPDVVLVQWWVPFWAPSLSTVLALARRRRPVQVVMECHNVLPHEGGGVLARRLTQLALAAADAFIVHADADARALTALGLRPEVPRYRVALPPMSLPPAPDRAAARARLGLPAEGPVLLFFGFVRPYKGLDHLLTAMPDIVARVPRVRLLVAGEFWAPAARFAERAAALGVGEAVRLDDRYVPNEAVGDYFAAADLVVLPYVEASQSAVVPLAAQFGVPVVASRVGGLPDVVADGVTGLLVPPADPVALAAAVVRVLTEPATLARLRAGTLAQSGRFSWDEVVRTVELAARGARP
jgi:glycosyltransferase involved in cell wall biosynthesis